VIASYFFVAMTIALMLYGQRALKRQAGRLAPTDLPFGSPSPVLAIAITSWLIFAFCAAFLASVFRMDASGRIPLSKAYPFTALSFPMILLCIRRLFREPVKTGKLLGATPISPCIVTISKG
jgi:multidrug transporter EmrE-like cation transporter